MKRHRLISNHKNNERLLFHCAVCVSQQFNRHFLRVGRSHSSLFYSSFCKSLALSRSQLQMDLLLLHSFCFLVFGENYFILIGWAQTNLSFIPFLHRVRNFLSHIINDKLRKKKNNKSSSSSDLHYSSGLKIISNCTRLRLVQSWENFRYHS